MKIKVLHTFFLMWNIVQAICFIWGDKFCNHYMVPGKLLSRSAFTIKFFECLLPSNFNCRKTNYICYSFLLIKKMQEDLSHLKYTFWVLQDKACMKLIFIVSTCLPPQVAFLSGRTWMKSKASQPTC